MDGKIGKREGVFVCWFSTFFSRCEEGRKGERIQM